VSADEFEAEKIRLRAIEPEDWEFFSRQERDTDLVRLGASTRLPASQAAERRWAEKASMRREGDKIDLVIQTLDGTVVGSLNVGRTEPRDRVFGLGISVDRQFWRNGYGRQAMVVLLRWYFNELGYQKAEVDIYAFNEASVRFHEMLGFQHEGRRRRSHFTRGQYHDVILMGITAEEFLRRDTLCDN
jgi:RimJ/RimL family protein N-acetyltransferase